MSANDNQVWTSRSGLNYTYLFYYEKKYFNDEYVLSKSVWMQSNWHMSVVYSFIYIFACFTGQWYMKSRPKYDMRRALIAWNFVLALFSIAGSVRIWPEFVRTLATKGLGYSVCVNDYTHGVYGCWAWLFVLSKVPELFDTAFIVLRKQKLIFLHWYHHATVLIYCWYSTSEFAASGRWFVIMNYTVHACMYTYYAFRALRFNIPKWVNIIITSAQISQMIIGITLNCIIFYKQEQGHRCDVSRENIRWSFFMYFTYFLLFFKFFYDAYIAPKPATSKSKLDNHSKTNGYHHLKDVKENGTNGHVKDSNNNINKKHN